VANSKVKNTPAKSLDDSMVTFIAEGFRTFVARQVLSEMKKRRTRLAPSDRELILKAIVAGESDSRLKIPRRAKEALEAVLQDLHLEPLFEKYNVAMDRELPGIVANTALKMAPGILKTLKATWPERETEHRQLMEGFYFRLERTWKVPFSKLSMLVACAIEVGEGVNLRFRNLDAPETPNLINVLTRLHARSCQVAQEILVLLKHGYSEGAMARWRTLHEIVVTMNFIYEHGESSADRYTQHDAVETYRAACQFQQNCGKLNYEPLTSLEIEISKIAYDRAITTFGRSFGGQYGWAAIDLKSSRPTFAEIERAVEMDHYRSHFKFASHNVHANPKGIFFKMGLHGPTDILMCGPSNLGLAEPGQNTALSLSVATATVIQIGPTMEDIFACGTITRMVKEISAAFVDTERKVVARTERQQRKEGKLNA